MSVARRVRAADRGQVIPMTALSMVVLVGVGSLAVDAGYLRFQQRAQQIATDSAAIAGANELAYLQTGRIVSAAQNDAALNGYTDGAASTTVTVNHPPASGAYAGSTAAVEVVVTRSRPSFFAAIFGTNMLAVTTRAVGVVNPQELACVYALRGDLTLNGGGQGGITAPTCGIVTNANLSVTGQPTVDARFIGYLGNGPGGGTYPQAQPVRLAMPVADPCSLYPACKTLAALNPMTMPCVDAAPQNPNALPPGRYCNAVTGPVTLVPTASDALYVFDSGFPTGSVSGSGVTIYNNSGGGITFNGNIAVAVTAPTSGPTSGMVYFQPASNTGAMTKNGQAGTINFAGGFYAPTADITLNGNLPSVSLFVAGSILMNGSGMDVADAAGLAQNGHAVLGE